MLNLKKLVETYIVHISPIKLVKCIPSIFHFGLYNNNMHIAAKPHCIKNQSTHLNEKGHLSEHQRALTVVDAINTLTIHKNHTNLYIITYHMGGFSCCFSQCENSYI